MGRTRLAKATIVELSKKIQEARQRKEFLTKYLEALSKHYSEGKISYERYIEITHKHTDGRTISELIEYYDKYIKNLADRSKKEKRIIITNQIGFILISLTLIFIILNLSLNIKPKFVGFTIQEQKF
ncbi:MAG: hypothetical protein KJ721_02975, partial [Nanoarchaeota archaeon]|nr:hypothetical protein [Nanoarchaeota archaeon]